MQLRIFLHRILVPYQGSNPLFPAAEAWSLNYWTTKEAAEKLNF